MGISINGVTKGYGKKRGIDHIHLELPEGGLTAIVGPSGCGKTTLLRTLAGFLQPDEGRILFSGRDVTDTTPQDRGAAMVFQQYALWPHMSVFENVAYGLRLRRVPPKEREERVYEVLRRVEIDLTDVKKRHPQQYSGGQQQRIALARALVVRPEVLLLDEPLSNLDAKVRERLRVGIRSVQQSFGITAVYVTHDQEEALSMADYVVVMNEGRVEQAGTPEEVYRSPATPFTAHFLGASHSLRFRRDGVLQQLIVRSGDAELESAPQAAPERASSDFQPSIAETEDAFLLRGAIRHHLFLGSTYRHMVEADGQSFFVDHENPLPPGPCTVRIPRDKAYWFIITEERQQEEEIV